LIFKAGSRTAKSIPNWYDRFA